MMEGGVASELVEWAERVDCWEENEKEESMDELDEVNSVAVSEV